MVSLSFLSSLFATALIITICAATKPLDFVLPFTSRQNLASCTIDSDCSVSGCTCVGKAGDKFCANMQTATKEITACSKCATSSDCPGDKRGCNSDVSRCGTCTLNGVIVGARACSTTTAPAPTSSASSGTGSAGGSTKLVECSTASDCKSGCTCVGDSPPKYCIDTQALVPALKACPKCTTNADCVGDTRGCDSNVNLCKTCYLKGLLTSNQVCRTGSTSTAGSTTPTSSTETTGTTETTNSGTNGIVGTTETAKPTGNSGGEAPVTPSGGGTEGIRSGSCANSTSCSNGCTCIENVCVKESVVKSKLDACPTCDSDSQCGVGSCDVSLSKCESCMAEAAIAANKACSKPDCIATAWLRERNLEHAALRHYGMARVLCFPGLPCGTEGHILRECTNDGSECKLVTYREVCERRDDCIRTTTAVSKLSHTYSWASHRVISKTTLELTSLSADTLSTPRSLSRLVAYAGDYLNRMGLGWITNSVVLFLSDGVQIFYLDITAQS